MLKNENIKPRELSGLEKENRKKEIYDTFANYLVFCGNCKYVDKTNMYMMRAESRLKKVNETGYKCPCCGKVQWELGYPMGTLTGFLKFKDQDE